MRCGSNPQYHLTVYLCIIFVLHLLWILSEGVFSVYWRKDFCYDMFSDNFNFYDYNRMLIKNIKNVSKIARYFPDIHMVWIRCGYKYCGLFPASLVTLHQLVVTHAHTHTPILSTNCRHQNWYTNKRENYIFIQV